jgi:hypothetical protein
LQQQLQALKYSNTLQLQLLQNQLKKQKQHSPKIRSQLQQQVKSLEHKVRLELERRDRLSQYGTTSDLISYTLKIRAMEQLITKVQSHAIKPDA